MGWQPSRLSRAHERAACPCSPPATSGQSVTAAFEGWYQNSDGSYTLLVGYFNRNLKADARHSRRARTTASSRAVRTTGQPTHFLPRRQWGVFTIKVPKDFGDKRLTWTIVANGQTTSIPVGVIKGYQVEPFKEVGAGQRAAEDSVRPEGAGLLGPAGWRSRATLTGTSSASRSRSSAIATDGAENDPDLSPIQTEAAAASRWCGPSFAGRVTSRSPTRVRQSRKTARSRPPRRSRRPATTSSAHRSTIARVTAAADSSAAGPTRT